MVVRRLAALLAVVALTAPVLAGCGGSDESATEEWAGSVCSELSSWVSGVEGAIQSLTEGGIPDEEAVTDAVDDVRGSTEDLTNGLQDLGRPETEAGDQAQAEVEQLGSELQEQLDEVEQAVEGPLGVETISAVTGAISAAAAAVSSAFESLQSLDGGDELRDAFESSGDCDSFQEQLDEIRP